MGKQRIDMEHETNHMRSRVYLLGILHSNRTQAGVDSNFWKKRKAPE